MKLAVVRWLARLYRVIRWMAVLALAAFAIYAASPKGMRMFTSVFGLIGVIGFVLVCTIGAIISILELLKAKSEGDARSMSEVLGLAVFHSAFAAGLLFFAYYLSNVIIVGFRR